MIHYFEFDWNPCFGGLYLVWAPRGGIGRPPDRRYRRRLLRPRRGGSRGSYSSNSPAWAML